MKKWKVELDFIIHAETRSDAYKAVGEIVHRHLRDMASIKSIGRNPVPDPDKWIAVNEPIEIRN